MRSPPQPLRRKRLRPVPSAMPDREGNGGREAATVAAPEGVFQAAGFRVGAFPAVVLEAAGGGAVAA